MKSLLLALALAAAPAAAQTTGGLQARVGTVTHVRGSAGLAVAEAVDITAAADTAGSLAGTTFTFSDDLDQHKYYAWYKVSGTGTDPATSGRSGIEVDIATGDTAATVAGATRTAINGSTAATYIAVTGATTHVILTNLTAGASTDAANGTPSAGFSYSITQGVSAAVAIAPSSVVPNLIGWAVCDDATNTSTYLVVGLAKSGADGTRLAKGSCLECPSCTASTLKAALVSAQAASNGYAVVQFQQ